MKFLKVLPVLLAVFLSAVYAQDYGHKSSKKFEGKIEQLEKIKLIEILDMDESTSLKFFARRTENKKKAEVLMAQRDSLLNELEKNLKANSSEKIYSELIGGINETEKKIYQTRAQFLSSLNDLFGPEKIAKLVLFEYKFRQEIRDYLFEHRKKRAEK